MPQDLTPDQAIEKLKALPEDKQRAVLTALSPEERKGILGKLSAPARPPVGRPLPGSPKGVSYTYRNPKEMMQQASEELGGEAMNQFEKSAFSKTLAGQLGHGALATLPAVGEVATKLAGGLMDWKTGAALIVSKLSPALSAAFFATQGARGAYDAIKDGKATPENVQNFLLGLSTVAAAGAAAGEGAPRDASGLSKVGQLRKSMSEKIEKIQPFARKVAGVEPAVKEAVGKAAEKQGDAIAARQVKHRDVIEDNLRTQREARTKIDQEKIAVEDKNRDITEANKAQAEKTNQRGQLEKTVDAQSLQLRDKVGKVEASVAKEANAKFNSVREKIGNPETPSGPLIETVKGVEKNILQDIPENIKEFRSILKLEGTSEELTQLRNDVMAGQGMSGSYDELPVERKALVDSIAKNYGEPVEESKPITWDKLQSIKSRLDARLRQGRGMNGDLKRALYETRDAVVDEMGNMADENGAEGEWKEARDFWRQYKEDFHEPTGPSGSGSPVAQSLDAVDPKNIRQPFLNKQATTGNRGVQILLKYPQHGGTEAATHAEQLLQNHATMSALPERVIEKPLAKAPEVHKLPANKPMPARLEPPTVDTNKVSRDAIAQKARNWGSFNARDIGILSASAIGGVIETLLSQRAGYELPVAAITYEGGKYAASRALNNPKVVEWLSKTPPEEAAALAKIPGADKVTIVTGLTDAAIAQAKTGKAPSLSPAAHQLLGPQNVARIMAASGANIPKTPGEARDRIKSVAAVGP